MQMDPTSRFPSLVYCIAAAAFVLSSCVTSAEPSSSYLVGTASVDITGPVADVNMMGYADPKQAAAGIHTRLRARAFIVVDTATAKSASSDSRVVFVNLDYCMASQVVTLHVIARLRELYGDLYTERNVLISGIHTHSAPGGFLQYVLYQVTSLGFVRETFDSLLDGIVAAVQQAHTSLQPASLSLSRGDVQDASINRSPSAYRNNPAAERARYPRDVDTQMTILRFDAGEDASGGPLGCIAWFAVHCTSLNSSNRLVSGDNKGLASLLVEEAWGQTQGQLELAAARDPEQVVGDRTRASETRPLNTSHGSDILNATKELPRIFSRGNKFAREAALQRDGNISAREAALQGMPRVVAAFAQSNEGDVSPNTGGTFCGNTSVRCEEEHSTCGGKAEACHGRGPGWPDHFASNYIVAERQANATLALLAADNRTTIRGSVDFRHIYVDMSNVSVGEPFLSRSRQVDRVMPSARNASKGVVKGQREDVEGGVAHRAGRKEKGVGMAGWPHSRNDSSVNGTWRMSMTGTPSIGDARRLGPQPVGVNEDVIDHTCPPAMGFSFAAGTTDGPGAFDFTQGDTKLAPSAVTGPARVPRAQTHPAGHREHQHAVRVAAVHPPPAAAQGRPARHRGGPCRVYHDGGAAAEGHYTACAARRA
eukprot:jgi/Mesvir1/27114/Mv20792-RA.1